MKTSIPANALPTRLSTPNKLSTTYTTNVLFPKLGPASVNKYVKLCAALIRDIAGAVSLVEKVKEYNKAYNTQVSVIKQPDAWLRDRVVFTPVLADNNIYNKVFIAGLTSFNDPVITKGKQVKEEAVDTTAGVNMIKKKSSPVMERSIVAVGSPVSRIAALTDINVKELKLVDGRIKSYELTPADLLAGKADGMDLSSADAGDLKIGAADLGKALEQQKKAYQLGNIMHGFSQSNAVIADLVDAKVVNTSGALIKPAFLSSSNTSMQLLTDLQPGVAIPDNRIQEAGLLVDYGFSLVEKSGITGNSFLTGYKANAELKNLVKKYCIGKLDLLDLFGGRGLPDRSRPVNTHLREWAFQRIERLDLEMGEPELRGPFSAESVSPNSELTISETFTNEQFNFTERSEGVSEQRSNERAVFTSSRFQSALSNMTESGVSDENSFTTDSTLLSTLREQRRAAIDKTLTSISTDNENRVLSGLRSTTSASRTYITRGKDARLATTELAFQVASQVKAEVRLEDVNLVWAPYIYSPFLYTHQIIRNYKETSMFEYIEQNLVVDPVRPVEEYETGTFKKELGIKGRYSSQSKSFNFPVPGQYLGDGWELDKAATTIAFRNGSSGDYNWDDFIPIVGDANADDLENWDVYFKSLRQESDRITGEATLETTDPEWFNHGFLVFNFQMRKLSDRSRAELRAYAAEQASAEAERRAVLSRSRQYGDLRKEELITRYAQSLDLREEAFTALIKSVFVGFPAQHLSYYKEIIRSCINWNNVTMQFDSNRSNNIPFAEYSRSHFMNAPGIRFILPIIRSAEDVFFDTIRKNGNNYYESAITEIQDYTNGYRTRLEELKSTNDEQLILDKYTREIVIGRHLEAVLSNHPFAE